MMRVGVGFGSNLGDRLENLRQARQGLLALPGVGEPISAPLFETAPVDCAPDAAAFLNSVVEVGWPNEAELEILLVELRAIETTQGRPSRYPRNAPRPVDLDILYAGGLVRDTPALILPHPRLHERRFVLAPLAVIRPDLRLPGQVRTIAELLAAMDGAGEVREVAAVW